MRAGENETEREREKWQHRGMNKRGKASGACVQMCDKATGW